MSKQQYSTIRYTSSGVPYIHPGDATGITNRSNVSVRVLDPATGKKKWVKVGKTIQF